MPSQSMSWISLASHVFLNCIPLRSRHFSEETRTLCSSLTFETQDKCKTDRMITVLELNITDEILLINNVNKNIYKYQQK